MTNYNRSFAKIINSQSGTVEYGPIPLTVVIHHHEEWDEDVLDPETGEPVGEVEHKVSDWDTSYIAVFPTAAEYKQMGYLPVLSISPGPAPEGCHWENRGLVLSEDGQSVVDSYEAVPDPMPVLEDYDNAMEQHLKHEREERGYTTREPDSYLTSEVPRWAQDARDWVAHRDDVMEYALQLINAVQSGLREPPTIAEFEAGLPVIEWTFKEDV